jgi:glycosyltransferase involved in cell wall biosynthesis
MAGHLVAVSEKIENFYLETLKTSRRKTSFIPNGIALYKGEINEEIRQNKRQWLCQKHGLDPARPVLLSLSRITPLKDQKFLIECLKDRPEYQLLIAGPASDQLYFDELKKLETHNIVLIGPQEAVNDYNLGCDLYLSASTHEGIPVAVLEALAVETPCLISDIAGHLTLNQHGHLIDSYKIHDREDFLLKCDEIVKNLSLTKKRRQSARKVVEEQYSVNTMVNHYLEVYQS